MLPVAALAVTESMKNTPSSLAKMDSGVPTSARKSPWLTWSTWYAPRSQSTKGTVRGGLVRPAR